MSPHSPSSKVPTDAALQIARDAAERLLADLSRAELLTDHWASQELGLLLLEMAMNRCLESLAETGWIGRENQLISSEFWRVAGDRLKCGALQLRAREKPRGYAGDFETLQLFYDQSTCDDPLGKLFDQHFQRQTAVEAVRARIDLIAGRIVEAVVDRPKRSEFRIASIGSGPAIEIQIALQSLPENYRHAVGVKLFDLDPDALESAAYQIGRLIPPSNIATHRENLYRLTKSASAAKALEESDFIFCTGLFDYLADDAAVRLLKFLYSKLAPGGKLAVGNFAPHNPSRAYMEWIGNWYLTYRDRDDLIRLGVSAGFPREQLRVGSERTGVDLFLAINRDEPQGFTVAGN